MGEWIQHEGDIWRTKVPDSIPMENYVSNLYIGDRVVDLARRYVQAAKVNQGTFEITFTEDSGFPMKTGTVDMVLRHQHLWMDMLFPADHVRAGDDKNSVILKLKDEYGTATTGLRDATPAPVIWEFEVINAYEFLQRDILVITKMKGQFIITNYPMRI